MVNKVSNLSSIQLGGIMTFCSIEFFLDLLELGNFDTKSKTRNVVKIHNDFEIYMSVSSLYMIFCVKCPNILNIYYSPKELKLFGQEMLVIYEILEHFELCQVFMYCFL